MLNLGRLIRIGPRREAGRSLSRFRPLSALRAFSRFPQLRVRFLLAVRNVTRFAIGGSRNAVSDILSRYRFQLFLKAFFSRRPSRFFAEAKEQKSKRGFSLQVAAAFVFVRCLRATGDDGRQREAIFMHLQLRLDYY